MKKIQINTEMFSLLQLTKIARETGLSINTVKSIAQGKQRRVDFAVLEKIAQMLNVSPLSLLEESENDTDK